MAIELRLLRYFAVVAEELHVGNAAARLYISQPALSQQIRALEEQVGLPLFVRHPRGMELTEAGEVLLEEARAVLDGSERLEATVEELRRGRTAGLRVGLPPGPSRSRSAPRPPGGRPTGRHCCGPCCRCCRTPRRSCGPLSGGRHGTPAD